MARKKRNRKKKRYRNPSAIAKDLRTPKYRMRVIPDKKKRQSKNQCKEKIPNE